MSDAMEPWNTEATEACRPIATTTTPSRHGSRGPVPMRHHALVQKATYFARTRMPGARVPGQGPWYTRDLLADLRLAAE